MNKLVKLPVGASLISLLVALVLAYEQPLAADESIKAIAKVGEGLNTTIFQMPAGTINVNLPEDLASGDTITGTVIADPAGNTPEEKTRQTNELSGYVVEVKKAEEAPPQKVATAPGAPQSTCRPQKEPEKRKIPTVDIGRSISSSYIQDVGPVLKSSYIPFTCALPGMPDPSATIDICLRQKGGPTLCSQPVNVAPVAGNNSCMPSYTSAPVNTCVSAKTRGPALTSKKQYRCVLPQVGQCGHPINIRCPGDGYMNDCSVKVGGNPCDMLAAGPRAMVARSPGRLVGQTGIEVHKGKLVARGKFNNIAVKLACPKLTLKTGETTTLTVTIFGLQGLTEPVKLTLDNHSAGVIDVAGGNHQTIVINPTGGNSQTFSVPQHP